MARPTMKEHANRQLRISAARAIRSAKVSNAGYFIPSFAMRDLMRSLDAADRANNFTGEEGSLPGDGVEEEETRL